MPFFNWGGAGYGASQNINPNSQYANWQSQQRPAGSQWEMAGAGPGQLGGTNWINPYTGAQQFEATPGFGFSSGPGPFTGAVSWTDKSGNKMFNPTAFQGLFGGTGQGNINWQAPEFVPYTGNAYQPGAGWDQMMINPGSMVDTTKVIESFKPAMERQIQAGFADAGNRMGQSGMAMSTPYAQALGTVEQAALNDYANTALQYKYNAAEQQAARQMAAQQANAANNLAAWQQQGQWGHEGQLNDLSNQFNAWNAQNQFNLAGAGMGLDAAMANQQYGLQQQQFMNQLLAAIMGGGL